MLTFYPYVHYKLLGKIETRILSIFDNHILSDGYLCLVLKDACQSYQVIRGYAKVGGVSSLKCKQMADSFVQHQCQLNITRLELYPRSNSCYNEYCMAEIDDIPAVSIYKITIDGKVSLSNLVEVANITLRDVEVHVVYEDILLTKERSLTTFLELIPPPPVEESYPKLGFVDIHSARISAYFAPNSTFTLSESIGDEKQRKDIKLLASMPIADEILELIQKTTLNAGKSGTDKRDIPLLLNKLVENVFIGVLGEKRMTEFNVFFGEIDDVVKQISLRWCYTYKDFEATGKQILNDAERLKDKAFRDFDDSFFKLSVGVEALKERWESLFEVWIRKSNLMLVRESMKITGNVLGVKFKNAEEWRKITTAEVFFPFLTKIKADSLQVWKKFL